MINKFLIYKTVINKNGILAQEDVAMEEMSELTKAILKLRRAELENKKDSEIERCVDHIREEMADVEIMIEQLKAIYGDIEIYKTAKILRLAKRIGMKEDEVII